MIEREATTTEEVQQVTFKAIQLLDDLMYMKFGLTYLEEVVPDGLGVDIPAMQDKLSQWAEKDREFKGVR